MNEVPELLIGGVYMVPIILAIVEIAKGFGLNTRYAPWLNGGLSVAFYGATVFLKARPDLEGVATVIASGALLFLVNSGAYNVAAKPAVKAARGL